MYGGIRFFLQKNSESFVVRVPVIFTTSNTRLHIHRTYWGGVRIPMSLLATSTATMDSLPPLNVLEDTLSASPTMPLASEVLWDTLYPLGFDVVEQRWYVTSTEQVSVQAEAEVETRLSSATVHADRLAALRTFMDADQMGRDEHPPPLLISPFHISNSLGSSTELEHDMFRLIAEEDEDVHRELAAREDYEAMARRAELQARLWELLQGRNNETYEPPSLFEDESWVRALLKQCVFETHVRRKSFEVDPDQTNEACPICFEPYGTSNATTCVFGQCGHHVCSECLHEDYATRGLNSCALCRQPLFVPPDSGVTLREFVAFAYDCVYVLDDFAEFYHWPPRRVYGRYATRWFFAYMGAVRSTRWWPSDGHWRGSRAYNARHTRRCDG